MDFSSERGVGRGREQVPFGDLGKASERVSWCFAGSVWAVAKDPYPQDSLGVHAEAGVDNGMD